MESQLPYSGFKSEENKHIKKIEHTGALKIIKKPMVFISIWLEIIGACELVKQKTEQSPKTPTWMLSLGSLSLYLSLTHMHTSTLEIL